MKKTVQTIAAIICISALVLFLGESIYSVENWTLANIGVLIGSAIAGTVSAIICAEVGE